MSTDDDDKVLFAVLALALIPFGIVWRSFVITELWSWFVVPFGTQHIGIWHAAGLGILISWLTKTLEWKDATDDGKTSRDRFVLAVKQVAGVPLFAWAMGAAFHAMMP